MDQDMQPARSAENGQGSSDGPVKTPLKMIIVDDEPDLDYLMRLRFRRQIQSREYEFLYAGNGKEALRLLEVHDDVDIVLADIHMPEMDGLTLLVQLGLMNPIIKVIMVSAYGDMTNIRTAMNNGAYDFVTKPIDFDDLHVTIEKTAKHVRQLKDTIRSIRENNILKMYVDENVIKFLAGRQFEENLLSTEIIEASVVFADLCGYTRASEELPPETMVRMLNYCFDFMVKAIMVEDGHVDKFMGDAVMAVFKGPDHLKRAAKSAMRIHQKADELKSNSIPGVTIDPRFLPRVAIGINSGLVVSGNVGSKSLRRLDYTVIGDVVNTASRLQGVALAGQIIVDKTARDQLCRDFVCDEIGTVALRNKELPVVVYNVTGPIR